MYIDAHTHLNDDSLFPTWREHLNDFITLGGSTLINIGVDTLWNERAIQIARDVEAENIDCTVKATVGIHPCCIVDGRYTIDSIDSAMEEITELYQKNKNYIVAIGEIGIDAHFDKGVSTELQKVFFRRQCQLAVDLSLPIVIHSRDDFTTTREVLQAYTDLPAIYFHSRTYSVENLQFLLTKLPDVFVGINGIVTYKNASDVYESLQHIPLQNLLLETDAPYLSPVPLRGKPNRPAHIIHTYEYVASHKKVALSELQKGMHTNACALYNLS